jgi:hypothetical protein
LIAPEEGLEFEIILHESISYEYDELRKRHEPVTDKLFAKVEYEKEDETESPFEDGADSIDAISSHEL